MRKETVRIKAQDFLNDAVAARLMEQLYFRYSGAVARGKADTPQSYADLMRDTKFSFKQVKRGLKVLRERRLVLAEQHLFAGKNVCHYKLPERVMNWLEGQLDMALEGQLGLYLEGQLDLSPEGQLGLASEGQLYNAGTSSGTSSETSLSEQSLAGLTPIPGKVSEEEDGMKTVKSVMDVEAAVKAQKILHKPNSASGLEFIWKKRVSEITNAPVVVKKLEFFQLAQFLKLCPPGKAEAVLNHVLDDWIKFVKQCEMMDAATHTPSIPRVGFLLNHVSAAVILAEPPKLTPKKHEAKGACSGSTVPLVSPSPPKPEPEVKKPQSLAEIWADPDEEDEE